MTSKGKRKEYEIDFLAEFAVWSNLHYLTDLELILLKGHLLLEFMLNIVLSRNDIEDYENFSFYKKLKVFETIDFEKTLRKDLLISYLKRLNKLRNNIAHEYSFDINNGELERLSLEILQNLKGKKFTKYTFKTKIVHSFSVLSINILEMTGNNPENITNKWLLADRVYWSQK